MEYIVSTMKKLTGLIQIDIGRIISKFIGGNNIRGEHDNKLNDYLSANSTLLFIEFGILA